MPSRAGRNYRRDGMLPAEYVPMRRDLRQYYLWVDEALDAYANYCAHLHQALGRVFYRDILTPFRNFDFRTARDGVARFGDECDPSNLHSASLDIMYEQMDVLHGLEVEYWFPCGYADIASNAP